MPDTAAQVAHKETMLSHIVVEMVEYEKDSVARTTFKRDSFKTVVGALSTYERSHARTLPFDTFVQVIEGKIAITINNRETTLLYGQSIVIPAHQSSSIQPTAKCKITCTTIKTGYES